MLRRLPPTPTGHQGHQRATLFFGPSSPVHSIENSEAIKVADLLSGVWRFRRSAFLLSMLLVPIFAVLVFLIPAKYGSTANMLVRLGRGAVSIDPTANLSQTVSLQESRLAQVNSVKALLGARELAERVVKRIGPERVLEPHGLLEVTLENFGGAIGKSLATVLPTSGLELVGAMSAQDVKEHLLMEEACRTLESKLFISSPKDTYTISLDIETGDPILSRDLMEAYIEEYKRFHVESHQATGSLAFFETQSSQARERALQAQSALRDAKTERGIVDLAAAKLAMSTALSGLKQAMLTAESELVAAKAEAEHLITQIDQTPEHIEMLVTRGIRGLAGSNIRQRLYDLEVAYQDAASKLTPEHPKMVSIRQQLQEATRIAKLETSTDEPQAQEGVNPVRQQLQLALQTTKAKIAGAETKRQSLEQQFESLTVDLTALNNDEVQINELTWEASLAESEYLRTAAARSTARQINVLDEQNMSEISIIQPPTLTLKKSSPKRLLLLIMAVMLAIAIGVGQAVLRTLLFTSTKLPNEIHDEPIHRESKIGNRKNAWVEEKHLSIDGSHVAREAAGDDAEFVVGGTR